MASAEWISDIQISPADFHGTSETQRMWLLETGTRGGEPSSPGQHALGGDDGNLVIVECDSSIFNLAVARNRVEASDTGTW